MTTFDAKPTTDPCGGLDDMNKVSLDAIARERLVGGHEKVLRQTVILLTVAKI